MNLIDILVLTPSYPSNESVDLQYVHNRNLAYISAGFSVAVLSFSANNSYDIDGIHVLSPNSLIPKAKIAISHAPNLRSHYRFLRKHDYKFDKLVFFFHGHEILYINQTYPEPYAYVKKANFLKKFSQNIYDRIKINLWRKFFKKNLGKSSFIFVSKWMQDMFVQNLQLNHPENFSIIPNSINHYFEDKVFDAKKEKQFDFITIRSSLDGSKYCLDQINSVAKKNPSLSFVVYGKGDFFKHNVKAKNIVWHDRLLTAPEIFEALSTATCALMPTKLDSQGVMSCEIASCAMPLITSNIPICQTVFAGFNNVFLHDLSTANLSEVLDQIKQKSPFSTNATYHSARTSALETDLLKNLLDA